MDTALVERPNGMAIAEQDPAFWGVMERVVTQGDLSQLSPEMKTKYYRYMCESVGLNPATQPFGYIKTQGGLKLYANRNATDQLRQIHRIAVEIIGHEQIADEQGHPAYMVTARAMMPDGRSEESIAVIPLRGLTGDDYANALMKCETKAKRRVTLSITGLSALDEMEAQSIAGARLYAAEDVERAEYALPAETRPASMPRAVQRANVHQQAELRRLAERGFPLSARLGPLGVESVEDLDAETAKTLIVEGRAAILRSARAPVTESVTPAPTPVEHVVPDAPFVLSAKQISLFWATALHDGWTHDAKRNALRQLFPERIQQDGEVSIKSLSRGEFDAMITVFKGEAHVADAGGGQFIVEWDVPVSTGDETGQATLI